MARRSHRRIQCARAISSRSLTRDAYRRSLVTGITNSVNGIAVDGLAYSYDALNRPTNRNNDTFGYNPRSEVVSAQIAGCERVYGYDEIGNSTNWTANALNQYVSYADFNYDADGKMLSDYSSRAFTYDAANRLKTFSLE